MAKEIEDIETQALAAFILAKRVELKGLGKLPVYEEATNLRRVIAQLALVELQERAIASQIAEAGKKHNERTNNDYKIAENARAVLLEADIIQVNPSVDEPKDSKCKPMTELEVLTRTLRGMADRLKSFQKSEVI